MTNPILEALKFGQSFWYDTLSRKLIASGELGRMIETDGIRGVTSNPTIFEKAMVDTGDYDAALRAHIAAGAHDPKTLYERLAIEDIRAAADLLHPVHLASGRADGYVSFEVSPHLAHDTDGTIAEGRRLFREVDRENVMIKVPGTREGMPAVERLVGEGVNVNVTLLFGLSAYRACAEAHLRGLEVLGKARGDLSRINGVASFFLSRIDAVIDARVALALAGQPDPGRKAKLERLAGKVAIANAKLAYVDFQELTRTERWRSLASLGAQPQRLLWASTGTKNKAYPKTMYVEPLIGPDTVNTVPEETFRAYLAEGLPRSTITDGVPDARRIMDTLAEVGIPLDEVTDELLQKGVESFSTSFDKLLTALEHERQRLVGPATAAAASHPV